MQHRNAPFGEPTSSLALADKEGAEPKPDARDREIWACLSRNHAFRHRAPSAAFEFEGERWISWVDEETVGRMVTSTPVVWQQPNA